MKLVRLLFAIFLFWHSVAEAKANAGAGNCPSQELLDNFRTLDKKTCEHQVVACHIRFKLRGIPTEYIKTCRGEGLKSYLYGMWDGAVSSLSGCFYQAFFKDIGKGFFVDVSRHFIQSYKEKQRWIKFCDSKLVCKRELVKSTHLEELSDESLEKYSTQKIIDLVNHRFFTHPRKGAKSVGEHLAEYWANFDLSKVKEDTGKLYERSKNWLAEQKIDLSCYNTYQASRLLCLGAVVGLVPFASLGIGVKAAQVADGKIPEISLSSEDAVYAVAKAIKGELMPAIATSESKK